MSVIAWDGVTMAADSAATYAGSYQNRVCKIAAAEVHREVPQLGFLSTVLFGVVGNPEDLARLHRFLMGETDKLDLGPEKNGSNALIASPEGAWLWQGKGPAPLIRGAKAAIGSGGAAALAAMFADANAIKAVEVTCAVDPNCCDPVQAFSLPQPVALDTSEIELHEAQPEEDHANDQPRRAGTRTGRHSRPRARDRRARKGEAKAKGEG